MNHKKAKTTLIVINIVVIIFVVLLLVLLGFYFYDDIKLLNTNQGQIEFSNKIKSAGFLGFLLVIIINTLQVVVAFIPGEFIEIICGMLYGPILGVLVCLIGFTIGTVAIFGLVNLLGKPFFEKKNENKVHRLKFLENETRALIIIFFIFLIPGTPKDFITYAVPLSNIKIIPFIIVTSIARIPSIITSTIVGAAILQEDFNLAFIISITTLVIAIIGIIFNKRITSSIENIVSNYQNKKL